MYGSRIKNPAEDLIKNEKNDIYFMNQLIHYLRYEPLGLGRADPRCAAFLHKDGLFAGKAL